jgi:hypothetical protein
MMRSVVLLPEEDKIKEPDRDVAYTGQYAPNPNVVSPKVEASLKAEKKGMELTKQLFFMDEVKRPEDVQSHYPFDQGVD